jgi:peptidyl-tRNA hydrolase
VVLGVRDESALRALHARLLDLGVDHSLIVENDDNYAGQATAIGVAPAPRSKLRRYFSNLSLLT